MSSTSTAPAPSDFTPSSTMIRQYGHAVAIVAAPVATASRLRSN